MDIRAFDDLAKALGQAVSRRQALLDLAAHAARPTRPTGRARRSTKVALSQLSPGPHTFTAKYALTLNPQGTNPRVSDRSLVVIPLP